MSRSLSGWLQGLFWATAATSAIAALANVRMVSAVDAYYDAPLFFDGDELQAMIDAEDLAIGLAGLGLLVWIATAIVLLVWMNKAHKATSTLEPANRRWTSGWTVGGWFIPFANFVIPKIVLNEIERIATAPRENGRVTASWRYQTLSAGGWAWWLLLVAASVTSLVSGTFGGGAELTEAELRSTYNWGAMSEAAFTISAVFGVFMVRRISAVLVPESLPQPPGWGEVELVDEAAPGWAAPGQQPPPPAPQSKLVPPFRPPPVP